MTNELTEQIPGRAGRREWLGLGVIALACVLCTMDLTVLHRALPTLSTDLEPSSTEGDSRRRRRHARTLDTVADPHDVSRCRAAQDRRRFVAGLHIAAAIGTVASIVLTAFVLSVGRRTLLRSECKRLR